MKNIYFTTVLLTAFLAVGNIRGQEPAEADGRVVVRNLVLEESDQGLLLAFDVDVWDRAINNRQSWRVVPRLHNGDGDSLDLPDILINGRQAQRFFKRKDRFGNIWQDEHTPDHLTHIPNKDKNLRDNIETINYRVEVPFEEWMCSASLTMYQYLGSSKSRLQLFASEGYGSVKLMPHIPYEVEPKVNYIAPEPQVKKRSISASERIDFEIGRSELKRGYGRNPVDMFNIDREVMGLGDNPDITIEQVTLTGYSSPDGPYAVNERLSYERVEVLKQYLIVRHSLPADIITTGAVAEDWEGLRQIVEAVNFNDKRKILEIIDSGEVPDDKEKRLRALKDWNGLVKDVFPQLRRTEYRIDFKVRDFELEESRSLILTNPELFSHRELFNVAMSCEGPERLAILESALRYNPGDDAARNNYGAALLEAGELSAAKRYLDSIENRTLAANNLGVFWMLCGDYGKAGECLRVAGSLDQALHNLREVQRKTEDLDTMRRRGLK